MRDFDIIRNLQDEIEILESEVEACEFEHKQRIRREIVDKQGIIDAIKESWE